MKPMKPMRRMNAAMAAVLALAAHGARAEYSADIALRNLGYELVDLRPDDGIAPAATLAPWGGSVAAYSHTFSAARQRPQYRYQFGYGAFLPLVFRNVLPVASLHVRGVWTEGRFDLRNRGAAQFTVENRAGFSLQTLQSVDFILTPFTRMDWSGEYAVTARADPSAQDSSFSNLQAFAFLRLGGGFGVSVGASARAFSNPHFGAAFQRETGALNISLENPGPDYGDARLEISTYAGGGDIRAVPEPGAAAMLLCGLGVLAARSGRRWPVMRRHAPG